MATFEMTGFVNFIQFPEKLENSTFRKLAVFPSTGEGRETSTRLDPLKRVNLNHWIVSLRDPKE
jgi:hypothetical protein